MIKRLVVTLAVLLGVLVLADRGLAAVAANAAANAVQDAEQLAEKPDVSFRGFPFLSQALRGRFSSVDVSARDVRRNGLTLSRVEAHLEGVRVSLSDALSGRVEAVPVRRGSATVSVEYADLNEFLRSRATAVVVSGRRGRLTVSARVEVPGAGSVPVSGEARVTVRGDGLRVTVTSVRAADIPLPAALVASLADQLSFTLPLGGLPFGIQIVSVTIDDVALRVRASAEGIVIATGL